ERRIKSSRGWIYGRIPAHNRALLGAEQEQGRRCRRRVYAKCLVAGNFESSRLIGESLRDIEHGPCGDPSAVKRIVFELIRWDGDDQVLWRPNGVVNRRDAGSGIGNPERPVF